MGHAKKKMRMRWVLSWAFGCLGVCLSGCSGDPKPVALDILTGHESDTFSQAPVVSRVDVRARTLEGDVDLKTSAAPGQSFELGDVPGDRFFGFDATGVDAAETPVVRGRSVNGILLSALAGDSLPVFVQRVNQWARPPGQLVRAHLGAPAASMAERYTVLTGGSQAFSSDGEADVAASEFYDFLSFGGASGPAMPRVAKSLLGRSAALLLIDDAGATWVDFDVGGYGDVLPPSGLNSFAEIAGARALETGEGRAYFIAGTKGGAASDAVLVVEATGSLSALHLSAPRSGAAALWIDKLGLVVVGGSADAAGVEILRPGSSVFEPLPFPPDETAFAAAAFAGSARAVVSGGILLGAPAPTRTLDLGCTGNCEAHVFEMANVPAELVDTSAYALDENRSVLVGSESGGERLTRVFLIDVLAPSAVELMLREPRRGAAAIPTPLGTLSLMGGQHPDGTPALTIETLFPL